jgi:hypothetical protein
LSEPRNSPINEDAAVMKVNSYSRGAGHMWGGLP